MEASQAPPTCWLRPTPQIGDAFALEVVTPSDLWHEDVPQSKGMVGFVGARKSDRRCFCDFTPKKAAAGTVSHWPTAMGSSLLALCDLPGCLVSPTAFCSLCAYNNPFWAVAAARALFNSRDGVLPSRMVAAVVVPGHRTERGLH
jgi:hypothetical protein